MNIRQLSLAIILSAPVAAHDLSDGGHDHPASVPVAAPSTVRGYAPPQADAFARFAPAVRTRWDERFLFIESNGLPAHNMMVGITAWQQQVPLPQNYTGDNAWRIPLHPVPAKQPLSIRDRFLRGAIAIAANGIPIFNPQNNRGEISAQIGELDQWGGHCGRADDYHYHAAPLHLQKILGAALPIAYALDGYPVFGLNEPDGSQPKELDAFRGHTTAALGYHYHASATYPYVMGGFHGEVVEAGGQVDPQPRANPVRPSLQALRGAKITTFEKTGARDYKLSYEVDGKRRSVSYSVSEDGTYPFTFDNGDGKVLTETYKARAGAGRDDRPPREDRERRGDKSGERSANRQAGSPGNDPNRQPWITAHASELDADHDSAVSLAELTAEAKKAFGDYDKDHDGKITSAESAAPAPRTAMGGFVKEHPDKIDADKDGELTQEELLQLARRMFSKQDLNTDGRIDAAEMRSSPAPERRSNESLVKPAISDTMKLNVYADNWFMLYVNGQLAVVDSIPFTPHNVISVDFLPEYPMTLAVLAKDNADPKTGLEYGSQVGDGGFILKFADGTVTNASWKAKCFFHGPENGDTARPKITGEPLPANWWAVDFDDHAWRNAREYTQKEVDPKPPFFEHDFTGARFIWTDDLALDNTVIFRTRIEKPGWKPRWNTKPDLDVTGAPAR